MSTPISLFDYDLPQALIAQTPVEPRESARLLALNRVTGERKHLFISDLPGFLQEGDLLVFNDSKVFKARLLFLHEGREHELLLLRGEVLGSKMSIWKALLRGGRRFEVGDHFTVGDMEVVLQDKQQDGSGEVVVEIKASLSDVYACTERIGHIPVPPYVEREPEDLATYQTVYAQKVGSVAAPTAGFHFTSALLETLRVRGVRFAFVTLHVGVGTFQPVKTETLEEHSMHAEAVELSQETVRMIEETKARGGRVIAVGTTTVRTLEGVVKQQGRLEPYVGDLNLFITPGFSFRVIDGLITNFHLPKSTLLALVSAFAGRESVLATYREAVERGYRFFSFGDAMYIGDRGVGSDRSDRSNRSGRSDRSNRSDRGW